MKVHLRKLKSTAQSGFTLIELLVVIGILAILLAITLIALNPTQHFQGARNAQRSSDVLAVLDAIYEYQSHNSGTLPASLSGVSTDSANPSPIAKTGTDHVDLCDLAPTYLADLPLDPSATAPTDGATPCNANTTDYNTGYTIYESNGRFTVSAPSAEGATVSVTR